MTPEPNRDLHRDTQRSVEIQLSTERVIPAADVLRLYSTAGWWPRRTASEVEGVLAEGSAVGAWDGGHLIGFARCLSDGRFRAYIEDVIVDPAHRNRRTSAVATPLVTAPTRPIPANHAITMHEV
jgi:ribosomal protein S18 acetylase RimI-like enzyme